MNIQNWIVGLIVVVAILYFVRKTRRAAAGKGDGHCNKCSH